MAANIRGIQFLRNNTVFNTIDLAKNAVSGQVSSSLDGSLLLARYLKNGKVETLGGFVHKGVNGTNGVTFIEGYDEITSKFVELSGKTISQIVSDDGSISVSSTTLSDGTKKVEVSTEASKIKGLDTVESIDGEISGVTSASTINDAVKNLYSSLKNEIEARKVAVAHAQPIGSEAIDVSEIEDSVVVSLRLDGFTQGSGDENTNNVNALTVTDDGLFLSTNWVCGTFETPPQGR